MTIHGRTMAALACVALLALVVVACGGDDNAGGGGGGSAEESGPINIGLVSPLTGQYAPIGNGIRVGAEAAVEEINAGGGIDGRQLALEVLDAGTDPSRAVQQTEEVIGNEENVAMLGVGFGSAAVAASPRASQAGMPYISMSAAYKQFDPIQPDVYGMPPTSRAAAEAMTKVLKAEGIDRVALMSDNGAFGTEGATFAQELAEEQGIEIVSNDTFGLDAKTFTATLTGVKSSGADALWLWSVTPQAVAVTKEWQQLRLPQRLVLSHGNTTPLYLEPACPVANGALAASTFAPIHEQLPDDNPAKEVAAAAEAAVGPGIDQFAYDGYGGIKVIQAAIEKAGETSREEISGALEDLEVVTPNGVYQYGPENHAGAGPESIVMVEIEDCELQILPGQDLAPAAAPEEG